MLATLDELQARFSAMSDRERMRLLEANVSAIAEVDTFLGEQLKLQVQERKDAEEVEAAVRKHRKKAFRWLQTAERRAKRPAGYRPSKVNRSVRRLSPLEKTRRKAFQKLATIQRRLAKKALDAAKRKADLKPKAEEPEPMEVIAPVVEQPLVASCSASSGDAPPEPVIAEPPAGEKAPASTDKSKQHSRKAKDPSGCGIRLAKKIDRLIADVLAPEPTAEEEHTELSGDPPADRSVTDAGLGSTEAIPVVADLGADPTAADPSRTPDWREFQESAWGRLTATVDGSQPSTLEELIDALNESAELRSAALLRSMERFRDCLDGLPADTPLEAPQELPAGDVLVLVKALMSRLR